MRAVVSLRFVVCVGVCGVYVQGCFLQDFNAHARQAGYVSKDSVLGRHSGDFKDFRGTADHQSSSPLKSLKSPTSPTAIPRIREEKQAKILESQNDNKKVDSSVVGALLSQQSRWKFTPYVSGGVKRSGADCSGFVQSVFSESFGTQLPRTTIDQMKGGKKIKQSKLQAGDLVFFKTGRGALGYHVGIYLQDGEFLHLSAKGGAKIASLSHSYWKPKFIKAVRYDIP
ncbi:C40 family peptidase [Helicobacter zhangjianzhongii]|uniref:NlpC/P60 family protein n=1 Tax=Helicobacter zhangjianzhongii TaxID=2974574 RepID=A0ACC6FTP7_9HELI|nr:MULTISPECIES: NlpC/P60 family protein [unclassified Helicobacter]MDL0080806.1 NlpC/P60 family protein [Helicobacter sp. CPD2-1]MDL0082668.1 NlpC/P60 family protein [Helicobacter sp. XJK30-2]